MLEYYLQLFTITCSCAKIYKELIVDYRKRRAEQAPINIDGAVVEQVESFKFLGVHITNELSWSKHTKTVMKRARQDLVVEFVPFCSCGLHQVSS
jgi:hypothetical protein